MINSDNKNKLLLSALYRHSFVFVLAFILILGSAAVLWNTHQQTKELNKRAAIIDAKDFASSVAQFRNFYSKTIVPAARNHGMNITHDYLDKESSIPLPATFAKDFGQSLSLSNSAYTVKLYSDSPFPWREDAPLDKFEIDSLEKIKKAPKQDIWSFETLNGVPVLRYARGDVLKENCVSCHNNYSGTPKTDWKTGDVRGVLEVIRPITAFESESSNMLKDSFLLMLALILSMVLLIFFVLRKLSKSIKTTYDAYIKEEKLSKELRASDVKMHAIVDSVQEVIIVLDENGVIQESNYAIESMFAYDQDEIVGKNISLLLDNTNEGDTKSDDKQHLIKEIVGNRKETIGINSNQKKFPIELFVNQAHIDNKIIYTASLRDISHFKKAEELTAEAHKAALESAELKSEFLANMSHEIRTPMNGVIGMTELLLHSELNNDQKDLANTVRESADSLLTIINDILDFSKIEAGKLSIIKSSFDLLNLVEGSLRLLSKEADHKNVEMTFFIDSNVPLHITQDAGRLRQILINLLSNALKFTQDGNIILHISMDENRENALHFSVIDTGIGITKDSQENLFDSFSQVDGSNSREHGGTGLGLAICKQLVELMDGDIGVQSELHVGSTFWFSITIDPIVNEVKPYIYGDHSVLMLSSSDLLNRYYKRQLEQWGMQSTIVKKLNDLTETLDKNKYDMLCIDTDSIYLDTENPESFLQVLNTIRDKSKALIVLYASRKQHQKIRQIDESLQLKLESEKNVILFEKPVRHSAIKALLYTQNEKQQKINASPVLDNKKIGDLKVAEDSLTEVGKISESNSDNTSFHILLAEDNLVNQKVATIMLNKLGYQVSLAENGKEAYENAERQYFDAILMDCQMPIMDGYEATRRIRALKPSHYNSNIPIIAFTAHAMKDDDDICKKAGMDDYLSKPVTLEAFTKLFEQWFKAIQERKTHYLDNQKDKGE